MFALSRVQFKPAAALLHLVVRNDIIAVALENNHVLRIDLANPSEIEGARAAPHPRAAWALGLGTQRGCVGAQIWR
jgi:hypothetical protein